MIEVKRVLVPVDFSACSREALEYAIDFAGHFDAGVDVLHVYRPPDSSIPGIAISQSGRPKRSARAFARSEAGQELHELLERVRPPGMARPVPVLACGDPAEEILRRAQQGGYSVIIMGTHGRTGLAHWLLGSVAERVLRRAPCPVLTVPPVRLATRGSFEPRPMGPLEA